MQSTGNGQRATDNYVMPPEWHNQQSIWLAWPHAKNDWPGKFAPIPWVYSEIIRHLTRTVSVNLLVRNKTEQTAAHEHLSLAHANLKNITFHHINTNRVWLRDSGPTFVTGAKGKTLLDWRFNAWAKYPNHRLDNKVPEHTAAITRLPIVTPTHKGKRVVLEGGSIDVNGTGTLLTTEECLLSEIQQRNPGFTKNDYEAVFAKYLGITNTIWLNCGITGDDTHGHVDDLARFINPTTVATVIEPNTKDENHAPLKENLKRLKAARLENGKPLDIVELPMPLPLYFEDTRLPASYANFLITNQQVLVPVFNDPNDRIALNLLADAMPDHDIVPIFSVDLVWGFGTIHCMSQQEPACA